MSSRPNRSRKAHLKRAFPSIQFCLEDGCCRVAMFGSHLCMEHKQEWERKYKPNLKEGPKNGPER